MVQAIHRRVWFNGTTSVVTGTDLDINTSFTIGVRFKTDKVKDVIKGLISKDDGTGAGNHYNYLLTIEASNVIGCRVGKDDASAVGEIFGATKVTDGTWYYVVVVWDRSAQLLKLYLNAVKDVPDIAVAFADLFQNDVALRIGAYLGAGFNFNGYMADAFIYNRALSEAEIQYNYRHPNDPIRRGLQISYTQDSIDQPAAGTWQDRSGNARNGALTNTVTSKYPAIRAGANAIDFDGVNDYVDFGDITDFGVNDFTISCWLRTPFIGANWNGILMKGGSDVAPAHTWGILRATDNNYVGYQDATDAGGAFNAILYLQGIPNGWHHYAVRRVGVVYTFWLDGVLKVTQNAVAVDLTNANALVAGSYNGGARLTQCGITEIALYSRGLSDSEIAYNFRHPNNPVRHGQIFRASKESLYGTRWYDTSGGGMNGVINGAPIIRNIGLLTGR